MFIIFFFYFLVLFQTSFLVHFNVAGFIPNFALLAVLFLTFFEAKKNSAILAAVAAGFFLDILSSQFIGYNVLVLLGIAIFIKIIFKKYVRIPIAYTEKIKIEKI